METSKHGLLRERARAIVMLSGGIDSAACVHLLLSNDLSVEALHVAYGQSAEKHEARAATNLSKHYSVPLHRIALSSQQRFGTGEIRGRNALLATIGMVWAPFETGIVVLGIHAGTPYADCSPLFVESMQRLFDAHSGGRIRLFAPFLGWTKTSIFDYCRENSVPVGMTYSCEGGTMPPCGACASCLDRSEFND